MERTLKELAGLVGGAVLGDGSVAIRGISGMDEAGPGDITFLANPRYTPKLRTTRASAVIIRDPALAPPIPAIVVSNPDFAFVKIAEAFADPRAERRRGIHPSAIVGSRVSLGRDVAIGPHCVVEDGASIGDRTVLEAQVFVGRDATIGRDCLLYPQVSVRERCVLGDRVILHCGAVVGADGFGYVTVNGAHLKIPQNGIAVLEDDVELGANTAVDRARFGQTLIRKGTKIDNLVQVAHGVQIGEHCLIASQVGFSGSGKVGHHVVVGGQVGFAGHIQVGDLTMIGGQAGVTKSLPPKSVVDGTPARPIQQHLRNLATLHRLPEALREMKKRIEALESRMRSPNNSGLP